MKIAIATAEENLKANINQTFGRAPFFLIYDTVNNTSNYMRNEAMNAAGGAGIKASQFLVDQNIDCVICYRLGENAVKVLSGANINLYSAKEDKSIQENIDLLSNNKLEALVDIHSGYHHG